MNEQILAHIKTLPLGGGYLWDAKKNAHGVTKDLIYKGVTILRKDTATYCTGLTFEAWFGLIGKHLDIAVTEMQKTQRLWYCATGLRGGCQDALIAINQGTKQTLETAQPGEFLQLWRVTGSGHSVIYTGHNEKEISYWSTQPKTRGIGYRSEPLTAMKDLFFVRANPATLTV